jgi:NADPH2:quinone reductase
MGGGLEYVPGGAIRSGEFAQRVAPALFRDCRRPETTGRPSNQEAPMRAVQCLDYGQPLRISEVDDPKPRDGQVCIDVEASGVNYVDALIVRGEYQIKPPTPFVAGSEVAGRVYAVGQGVEDLAVGDRVFSMTGFGGFAERVAVGVDRVSRIPESMSAGQAAAFTQSYSTALFSLRDRGRLVAGETVLVLGAAGGVGRATIDVAKALGAKVIAAASSAEKLDACRALGADEVINYANEELKTRARELSGGGVDLVMDPVGGPLAEQALRAMGFLGRYLVIGFAAGEIPRLPLNQVLLRNRNIVGVDWGAWMISNGAGQRALLGELLAMVEAGRLSPDEPSVYPLEQVEAALDDLMHRRVNGKAVLVP